MFSERLQAELRPNRIAQARARHGEVACDLTLTNPTCCELPYPPGLLDSLADPRGLRYAPDPRGLPAARAAVAAEYRRHGVTVDPERVLLTASTSEAYAFLFKLLCEPGDEVLAPSPSYPLFELLARVEGISARPYHLDPEHGWRLDLDELRAAPARVRAVIVVHPNNPTGSLVHPDDAAALEALCRARRWALIADEVFLDYPLAAPLAAAASFAGATGALTCTLGGLSKSAGLPQLKLAWIVVTGPADLAARALERLEFIADAFLSVATPVQLALPALLRQAAPVREAIAARCRGNLDTLQHAAAAHPAVSVLAPGGGWGVVVRIPAVVGEEELVLELLEKDDVAAYPGFFFDFPRDGYLVLSLLPPPALFGAGVGRLLARVASHL